MKLKHQKEIQRLEARRIDELVERGLLRPGGIAIDGGAHVGSMTVKMAKHFDVVLAFEPCRESYDYLVENIRDSGFSNVHCTNQAFMDRKCKVNVHPPREKIKTLTARRVDYGGDTQANTIDSLHLEECSFIKLDLEGCEYLALMGAMHTINKFKPFLLVEFNGHELGKRFGYTEADLRDLLCRLGYVEVYVSGVDHGFEYRS